MILYYRNAQDFFSLLIRQGLGELIEWNERRGGRRGIETSGKGKEVNSWMDAPETADNARRE